MSSSKSRPTAQSGCVHIAAMNSPHAMIDGQSCFVVVRRRAPESSLGQGEKAHGASQVVKNLWFKLAMAGRSKSA
jgi:hypothetical protein